ncbi:MAG: hypothetical protein HGA85_00935 [Nanoarchaeota archaeon]|nr:hypothetical protein [Nanoarchaeota archaeon]
MKHIDEIFGWYGAVAILAAYGLHSFEIIDQGFFYQFLNFTGSAGLCLIAYRKKVFQSVVLNIIWALVAAIAIAKLFV